MCTFDFSKHLRRIVTKEVEGWGVQDVEGVLLFFFNGNHWKTLCSRRGERGGEGVGGQREREREREREIAVDSDIVVVSTSDCLIETPPAATLSATLHPLDLTSST